MVALYASSQPKCRVHKKRVVGNGTQGTLWQCRTCNQLGFDRTKHDKSTKTQENIKE